MLTWSALGRWTKSDCGASLVEAVLGVCVAATLAAFAAPITASAVDEGKARQAAGFLAARLREARQQAVTSTATTGLVFDAEGDRWIFRRCVDANRNGVRRAEIGTGQDACPGEPVDLATLFPGVRVAVDPAIRGPDNDAPSADPVRLGSSDIASFAPSGGCTPGSLYVRSSKGAQFVVRIAGISGRMRVLRYDAASGQWIEQ
jgi:hypothetical protein